CTHSAETKCSGSIGCKVQRVPMAAWNGDAPRGWSDFVLYLRRSLGVHVEYFGCWEFQARGALHRHALMRAPGVSEKRMRTAVRWAATRKVIGFGRETKVDAITGETATKVAGYCAKYTCKSADETGDHDVLNRETGELAPGGFRPWSSSRGWGESMGSVKAAQRAYGAGRRAATAIVGDGPGEHRQPGDGLAPPGGNLAGAGGALDPNTRISTQRQLEHLLASIAEWSEQLL
ncbi:MAG: hypothetical protein WA966_16420, partial [Ornithinimicrobium sp.]